MTEKWASKIIALNAKLMAIGGVPKAQRFKAEQILRGISVAKKKSTNTVQSSRIVHKVAAPNRKAADSVESK